MASNNRATQINKVIKVSKKHYKPAEPRQDRGVLEHLLFACCLENSTHNDADGVFESLSQDYFDWNEVRVTSIRELSEVMKPLNDPEASATRLKRVLQSLFESHYSFDLEPMRKQNIGQAVKQLEKYKGASSFTVAYVTQNALGGHSIPVNQGLLQAMLSVGVISEAEAAKNAVPGLERAVPKTQGFEIGSLLHQLGVELHRSPYGPAIRKLLLEIEPKCKEQLPKRPSKKVESKKPAPSKTETAPKKAEPKKAEQAKTATKAAKAAKAKAAQKTAAKKTPKKPAAKTASPGQKKKKVVKKAGAGSKGKPKKKPATKKAAKKAAKSPSKPKKKTPKQPLGKRKPR
jgi:endonuclease III